MKEESVTKNSRKVSGKKRTHGSKIIQNVKKQITNITIYRQFFVFNICTF